ncbi:MAG: hypothetical protein NTV30_06550, partial [Chloroflexi bacterium]|nr:hypothetical protein [Chloroflexota bacterium]
MSFPTSLSITLIAGLLVAVFLYILKGNDIFIPTREKQLHKLNLGLDKAIEENDKRNQAKYLYNLGIMAHRMKHY